ncbi:TPA: glycosyltransferase [Vibrio parahaemolyticus]|uniref:glycosyltransferase n=1 Tax=Vibrio parahaemolyticus TaxID=670 RepID=UPI001D163EE3|nr:glycosyltransferase [Vibrio parahaemolyticus]MCC3780840.1 glycosyltransferase [Vibrio parahaemolyticus]
MSDLAFELDISFKKENRKMFDVEDSLSKKAKRAIFEACKKTSLPPLEWYVPYRYISGNSGDYELVIETGSKLINTQSSYITYVENGLGLFGFNNKKVNRFNAFLFKKKIRNRNFKGFVFYSHTARISTYNTMSKLGIPKELIEEKDLGVIYPFTSELFNQNKIEHKEKKETNILFCSSTFSLKGGREALSAFKEFSKINKASLTIVTDEKIVINEPNIKLMPFNLSSEDVARLINSNDVIIHPTYFDSHSLFLIEALKLNKFIIATKTFAISEIVRMSSKSILLDNPHKPYSKEFTANFLGTASEYIKDISNCEEDIKLRRDILKALLSINVKDFSCSNEMEPIQSLSSDYILQLWKSILARVN